MITVERKCSSIDFSVDYVAYKDGHEWFTVSSSLMERVRELAFAHALRWSGLYEGHVKMFPDEPEAVYEAISIVIKMYEERLRML